MKQNCKLAFFMGCLLSSVTAFAAPMLNPVIYSASIGIDGTSTNLVGLQPILYTTTAGNGETTISVVATSTGVSTQITSSASSNGGALSIVGVAAITSFQMMLAPASPAAPLNVTVPALLQGTGQASCEGIGTSEGRIIVAGQTMKIDCPDASSFSLPFLLTPNLPITVQLVALGGSATRPDTQARSSIVLAQPAFLIDPQFADSYSLVFSSGYSPTTAVPEPSAAAFCVLSLTVGSVFFRQLKRPKGL